MPSKNNRSRRVRFSEDSSSSSSSDGSRFTTTTSTTDSESPPNTPSLTYSSLPSSPTESLSSSAESVEICPLLALSSTPAILFDASRPPLESFTCNGFNPPNKMARDILLAQSIIYPPTRSLTLVSSRLPWYIKVEPVSSDKQKPYYYGNAHTSTAQFVTIADLLSCVFKTLQRPVTPAEFTSFLPPLKVQVTEQFYRRLDRICNAQEKKKAKEKGVKRVDVLLGSTTFMGLSFREDLEGDRPSVMLHFK